MELDPITHNEKFNIYIHWGHEKNSNCLKLEEEGDNSRVVDSVWVLEEGSGKISKSRVRAKVFGLERRQIKNTVVICSINKVFCGLSLLKPST